MIILFFDILIIRRKYADIFSRIRLAPDWLLYICSVCGSIASISAIYVIFTAPWTNPVERIHLTTAQWDTWIASIVIISLVVAVFGFYPGRTTTKSDLSDEEIIKEVTG